jgi:lipopolysaccharide heptosyltransferase I
VKILILKPSSLGDVVQALPVARLLKQHYPSSSIFWWLDRRFVPLLDADPDLAGIIPFERNRWSNPRYWLEAWQSLREIRAHQFDLVIDLQSLLRSGVVAWLANGGCTAGLDDPREGARAFYDIAVPRANYHFHAVDWYLSVLTVLGVPVHWNFQWLPPRKPVAATIREKWPMGDARWIALQPGARWQNKRWPLEHFIQVVQQLSEAEADLRFVILGSAADAPLGQAIREAAGAHCLDLTGTTSLPEMVEWIRAAHLLITNDTGPMHVAAALRKPLIALFGPTERRRTGPYGQLDHVLQASAPCVPCMKPVCHYRQPLACLRGTQPAEVVRLALAELSRTPRAFANTPVRAAFTPTDPANFRT